MAANFVLFSTILVCFISFIGIPKASGACGLNKITNFEFISLTDTDIVGQNLGAYDVIGVQDIKVHKWDGQESRYATPTPYFSVTFNETKQQIVVQLARSLENYFEERWSSNFETVLQTTCKSGETNEDLVLLAVVEDTNNNAPVFTISDPNYYNFEISNHWPEGVTLNKDKPIKIADYDFEFKNAEVHVNCESVSPSDACSYLNISLTSISKSKSKSPDSSSGIGYFYGVEICLAIGKQIKGGTTIRFELVASDGENETRQGMNVTALAGPVDPGSDGSGSENAFPIIPVAAGGGILFLAVLVISWFLGVFVRKNKKTKEILNKLTQEEIKEFRQGASAPRRGSVDFNATIATLPFKKDYEIPRENLKINETCILGSGAFGVVYKGTVLKENDAYEVAVKMLKQNMTVQYFKALMDELKIMAYIGKHPNVVRLVGSCSKNIKKLELYVAVEYCIHGNIRDFLKFRRASFANMVVNGVLTPTTYIGNIARQNSFGKTHSTMDLIGWAQQIANGMDYLSSKQVIHGDLAARNILIDSERIAKISDFGLSRRLVDCTNYSKTSKNTPLPLRWMAPESLKFKKFSTKTDTWSFGILLWEVFALGQTPYPGVPSDEKFVDKLDAGLRMTRPEYAPTEIYAIMTKCWDASDFNRPSFLDIKKQLQGMQTKFLALQGEGYMTLGYMGGLNNYTYRKSGLWDNSKSMQQRRRTMSIFSIPKTTVEEENEEGDDVRSTFSVPNQNTNRHTFT
jgi:serine/threonine protein kinase